MAFSLAAIMAQRAALEQIEFVIFHREFDIQGTFGAGFKDLLHRQEPFMDDRESIPKILDVEERLSELAGNDLVTLDLGRPFATPQAPQNALPEPRSGMRTQDESPEASRMKGYRPLTAWYGGMK